MQEEELKKQMKDFLIENVVSYGKTESGDIFHKFKNGKTRTINIFKRSIEITEENGKLLFSTILDENHPLIVNGKLYYQFYFVLRPKGKIAYLEGKRFLDEFFSKKIECDEIYQLK